jgi:tetratricopeptide (TPR) repeat protein
VTGVSPSRTAPRWRYLLQESVLFLLTSYVVLVGGTFNGLIQYQLNLINAGLIVLGGAAWLGWMAWRRVPFPATRLDGPLLGWVAVTVLAGAFSADPRRSAGMAVLAALYVLVFYAVVSLVRAGWPRTLFLQAQFFASLFVLFFCLWELQRWYADWLTIAGWSNPLPPATVRISGLLTHPNLAASFFVLLAPSGVVMALRVRPRWKQVLWAAWCLAAGTVVFFTSSRSGWLGLAGAVAALSAALALEARDWLALQWRRVRRSRAALAAGSLGMLLALAAAGWVLYRQSQHPSHAGRDYIWRIAVQMFWQRPLLGNGPFTFGTEFIRAYSVPPEVLLAHAHNWYLNVLAETGLLGGLALAWCLAAGAALAWRRWRTAPAGERAALAGLAAALFGLAITSLFETPQMFPAVNVLMMVLLGLLAAGEVPGPAERRQRLGGLGLAVLWLGGTAALAWSLYAYAPFSAGALAANLGDWRGGAQALRLGAERDPGVAFYWLQAGYAHGRAALAGGGQTGDARELSAALDAYERGVVLEPAYSTNWVNLGLLRWASGDLDGARAALERAVGGAESNAVFRATLGRFYETTGQPALARGAYQVALELRPDWVGTYFFRETELRREAAGAWRAAHPDGWLPGGAPLAAGWRALRAGDPSGARQAFAGALGPNQPEPYLGLGLAALAEGGLPQAEQALRTALWMGGPGTTLALVHFGLGQVWSGQGRVAEAIRAYETGLGLIGGETSEGIGRLATGYGWFVFNRNSILPDLLPGAVAALYFDEAVEAMLATGDLYLGQGASDQAQHWYCQALAAAPDSVAAQARAAEHGGCEAVPGFQP